MECNAEELSLVKPPFCSAGFIQSNFIFLTCLRSAEQLPWEECFVFCKSKRETRHLGAFSFSLLVQKVREEVLTTACSYGGLEIKLAYILKYVFYLKITLKPKVLSGLALHFFVFRISGKYQTMSFRLTVVLFPELEIMKQWQVFIKPHLQAHYDICNN